MTTWFVARHGQTEGPFTPSQIQQGLRGGQYSPETMVWRQGLSDWLPLGQVSELSPAEASRDFPPPPLPGHGQQAHDIDYEIFGQEMQFVEIELDQGESVVAEAGAMMYMGDGIRLETIFGDGSARQMGAGLLDKVLGAGKRLLTGESLFCTLFTSHAPGKSKLAFAAPYPGKIIPLDLRDYQGTIICQKDAFLAAAKGVAIGIHFQRKIGVALFGGEGFIMQKLEGDGLAFVHAGGTIVEKELQAGESLAVDTGCLVAMTQSVHFDIQTVGGIKSSLFGGEGFFLAKVTGPGHVWLQSLPFSRLAGRIHQAAVPGGRGQDEGSVLGGLENLFKS